MLVVIDAVGIRGHGGAAVLSELLHCLPRVRPEWRWHVFLFERSLREFDDLVLADNVTIEHTRRGDSGLARLRWVNSELQKRVRAIGADTIFSFANIGSDCPCRPQVVFVQQHNAFFSGVIPKGALFKCWRLKLMRRQILRGAQASRAVIVQTENMRSRMRTYAPQLSERIHVIPSGYRTPSANPVIRPEKKALIGEFSRPRLIYISHPSEHKNYLNLVKALPGIIRAFPSTRLMLTLDKTNPPNTRYASFVQEILSAAQDLGVSNHLVWLGILGPDEVSYALSQCDLMVFPSLAESFGLGLVEAMASTCPIAASDLPYAHEVAGDAAVYFDPFNPKDISQVIVSTLNHKDEIARMKSAGNYMTRRYSYQDIAHRIAKLLNSNDDAGTRS